MLSEWRIGQLCDEFHCLPGAVVDELQRDPEQLMVRIFEYRAYARAWRALETTPVGQDLPDDPMLPFVKANQAAILRAAQGHRR